MKKKHFIVLSMTLVAAIMLTGCGVELLATTAVRGELEAQNAKSAMKQLNYVKGKMGSINVEQAIQAYRADKGVNPPSLAALVPTYLAEVPKKEDGTDYNYDPVTGKLTEGPISSASGMSDMQTMEKIKLAINQYGTATGYYPPTLDDLYPNYLPQPPRTAAGQQFIYNNQNGYLAHPTQQAAAPAAPQQRQRAMGGGAGVGPMGEVMTGIGMQQQLNSMGSSGANAAQSRSRVDVNQMSSGHTNTQNQVMDQLGL
jgi:hypothetical protein